MGFTGFDSDWFSGAAAAATGMGVLTFTLFPLAIPLLLLTLVAVLPFVLPLVVLAGIAAILAGAWRGIRAAGRAIRQLGSARPPAAWVPPARPKHCHD
jgi:hypothetical protein